MAGTLYIVATPIGNLDDLSARVKSTFENADLVLCEDTRRTLKLLNHLGLRKPLESFHEHNSNEKIPEIISSLELGKNIALATDAGTPGLSDPGADLVRACHQLGVKVVPVPGPSAITAALSVSGFPADRFLFLGFLPAKSAERKKLLETYRSFPESMILFEAPHRVRQTLQDLIELLGDRPACLCRELTKVFEEVRFSTLQQIEQDLEKSEPKGEISLVIRGAESSLEKWSASQLDKAILGQLRSGKSVKDLAHELAQLSGYSKKEIYQKALALKDGG